MKAVFSYRYWARPMKLPGIVCVPDQVAESPDAFFFRSFPVLRGDGSKSRAIIEGCLSARAFAHGVAVVKIIGS